VLYNNMGVEVSVRLKGKPRTLAPDRASKFDLEKTFQISIRRCSVGFIFAAVPNQWIENGRFRRFVRFQLEGDGLLYLVAPGDSPPVDTGKYPQPDGYPLVPRTTGECDWRIEGSW
jgi:hypothetical protein